MSAETTYSKEIEFRSSEILESRREVDYYEYLIKNSELYSKVTGRPVRESILARTRIERIELFGFNQIELWSVFSDNGSCVWVSPPARSDLSAKAVISEIGFDPENGKILTNRNICFDWDESLFLHFAEYCRRPDIKDGEDLRGKPIFLLPEEKYKLYELLEQLEPSQVEQVQTGEDIRNKENLKAKIASGAAVARGGHSLSCDSAFNVFSESKWCEKCPLCGKLIRDFISVGYRCKKCGGVKRC